jgi:glutamate racemase
MLKKPIDHLVLGCTHYPFLNKPLKSILPKNVTIVDCGEAVAKQTKRLLESREILNTVGGRTNYYSTAFPNKKLWKMFGVIEVNQTAI